MSMKNSNDTSWDRTSDLPICSTAVITEAQHFCREHTKFYTISCSQGEFQTQRKLLWVISVDFDATGRLLIIYSVFVNYLRKKWE